MPRRKLYEANRSKILAVVHELRFANFDMILDRTRVSSRTLSKHLSQMVKEGSLHSRIGIRSGKDGPIYPLDPRMSLHEPMPIRIFNLLPPSNYGRKVGEYFRDVDRWYREGFRGRRGPHRSSRPIRGSRRVKFYHISGEGAFYDDLFAPIGRNASDAMRAIREWVRLVEPHLNNS